MADPGDRVGRRRGAQRGAVVGHPGGVEGPRRGEALPGPARDERPARPGRRPAEGRVQVAEAAARRVVRGQAADGLGARARAGDDQQQEAQRRDPERHSEVQSSAPVARGKRSGRRCVRSRAVPLAAAGQEAEEPEPPP